MSELKTWLTGIMESGMNILMIQETGSRYICSPPPMNTDDDVIVLATDTQSRDSLIDTFENEGYEAQASGDYDLDESDFLSLKMGEKNILLTTDHVFYNKFCLATDIAKKHNLLNKQDRIQLFQAILYGNRHEVA